MCNHVRDFNRDLRQLRSAARHASRYARTADDARSEDFGGAAPARIEQLPVEHLFRQAPAGDGAGGRGGGNADLAPVDPARLTELVKIVATSVGARQNLLAVKRQLDQIRSAVDAGRADKPADGRAVANRVRQILGMPALEPDQDT